MAYRTGSLNKFIDQSIARHYIIIWNISHPTILSAIRT